MDGGAGSQDAFRCPDADEVLTYPFASFVIRYGGGARLSASTAALAGVLAELPPSVEEPYRLMYFVVTDQMRTTIAVLRAVLKEGLDAPLRLPRALVIDQLHTLEVFRKQGLATSLINFVKGIAEAHGIGLYASCGLFLRSFWELRGFEEETSPELLDACNVMDGLLSGSSSSTLLRAGAGYTEYQPANGERLSIIRPFHHDSQSGNVSVDHCSDNGGGAKDPGRRADTANGTGGKGGTGKGGLGSDDARVSSPDNRLAGHEEEGEGEGERRRRDTESLAASASSGADTAAAGGEGSEMEAETAAAAAANAATAESTSRMDVAAGTRTGGDGGPGPVTATGLSALASPLLGVAGAGTGLSETSGIGDQVKGYLGWPTQECEQVGAGAGAGTANTRVALAARGLLAIPSSGLQGGGGGGGGGADVVDLTAGFGGKSLAEQDEEQLQLAIALSISEAEPSGGGGGDGGGGGGHGHGQESPAGDDTETEEDVDYGGRPPSSGDTDSTDRGSPHRKRAEVGDSRSSSSSSSSSSSDSTCRGKFQGERAGGRGLVEAGRGDDGDDGGLRRIRRRRDESGTSIPGEQSLDGADGAATATTTAEGGEEMELDDAGGVTPPSSALSPLNAAAHSNVSSFRHAGLSDVSDAAADAGPDWKGSGRSGGGGAQDTENVCFAAARGRGADENDYGAARGEAAPGALTPWPLSVTAVAAGVGAGVGTGTGTGSPPSSSPRPSAPPSPCPSSSSSCSFSLEPHKARPRAPTDDLAAPTAPVPAHGDPGTGLAVSALRGDELGGVVVDRSSTEELLTRGQQPQRPQRPAVSLDGGGMITALDGVVIPSNDDASGGGGGGGGGFAGDDFGGDDVLRDFGVGPGGLEMGRLDDKLLAVAGWQGDDNDDEELRRVMEASRRTHEEEMLQRATQESQEMLQRNPAVVMAETPHASGGGPDVAVLPPSGSRDTPRGSAVAGHAAAGGTAYPGTGGGPGANGFQAGGGGGAGGGSAASSSGGAPWVMGGWEDGEVATFAGNGKGKGKGRWRD